MAPDEPEPEPGPVAQADERGRPSAEYSGADLPKQDLAEVLSRIARSLDTEQGIEATVKALLAAAVETIPGAESVGITEVRRRGRHLDVTYASDEFVEGLDAAQHELAEGPCWETAHEHHTVRVEDFATEQRWPRFAARARELGAGSLLSLQLYVHGQDLAALNVYSRRPQAFTDESEQIGLLFAAHAAIAVANVRRMQQMRSAVDSRDVIGQAKGILMERFKITADQAFIVLARASSEMNMKLRDVAESFAGGGQGPPP